MEYRIYGATGKLISEMSFGSTRFNPKDLDNESGLVKCSELIVKASQLGVNYFDIAHNYAKSQCESIYKRAFREMKQPYYVTSKSSSFQENSSDDVLRRIERSLKSLDVDKIHFFYMWSIMDETHYRDIIKKGGAYEGALKAKERGLIDHIVFSNHASSETALKIIEEGLFEGITVSYNLLNFKQMDLVIDAAHNKKMGVTVMNPLAGGIIPQNEDFFAPYKYKTDKNIVDTALRFIHGNEKVTSIILGINNEEELNQNIQTIESKTADDHERIDLIKSGKIQMSSICTGCGYCREVCPRKIKIPEFMQSYNMTFFKQLDSMYGRSEAELIRRISVLRKLVMDFRVIVETDENECIKCGQCEKVCTQHLPIISRLEDVNQMIKTSSASLTAWRDRLDSLINRQNIKKVAFYTSGGYTAKVIELYKHFFGEPGFELMLFDSNASKWGETLNGYQIYNPTEIPILKPDVVIISNYNFDEEIYQSLSSYREMGFNILKLHGEDDVPWVF